MSDHYIESCVNMLNLYDIPTRTYSTSRWYLLPFNSEEDRQYFTGSYYGFDFIYHNLIIDRGHINKITDISKNIIAGTYKMSQERMKRLENMIYKNQTFRWKVKRLIHNWRLARIKQANTDDILTGEPPKMPIYIYDWPQRTKYVLEAHTVFRDICERLFKADGLFTNTLYPRNMFTNSLYSLGQMHFIIKELRAYGYSNWAIEGLKSCNYCLKSFKEVYKTQIHLEVLKRCFANYRSSECINLLLDFIELEYEFHEEISIPSNMLLWYIKNYPDCSLIQAWRKICFTHYKNAYTNKYTNYNDITHSLTLDLINIDTNFIYNMYRRSQQGIREHIYYYVEDIEL
jgi:hypothetical protein